MNELAVLEAWDRIDDLPDPIENTALVGHEDTLETLCQLYASQRMHHAWLVNGPRGIGKATMAARFATHLFRHPDPGAAPHGYEKPDPDDPVESRVARGGHPNLLHLRRPWDHERKRWKTTLTVDEIRRTISFFGTSSAEKGWRVAIVDTADDLNASAANALLKILEEPPERTVFLVLAHSPKGLLATIRSRCQLLQVRPLSQEQVMIALNQLDLFEGTDRADAELAARLSNGSVRRAITILREDGSSLYRQLDGFVKNRREPDWQAIHEFANSLSPANRNDRYRLFLDLTHDYVARRVRGESEPMMPETQAETTTSVLAGWVEVWEKTRRSADLVDAYNLDRKQVVLNLFSTLRQMA